MKITALATISAITGASAQLSKKPLRGGAKDLAEDDAAHTARVLQGSMSMTQTTGEFMWDGKWPAPETTTTEATDAGDWSDWKGTSKASKSTTSSKGSKDWWSAAPTVSNAPSSEKEWSAGKSGKSDGTSKSGKGSSKDWWSAAPTVSNAPSESWSDWKSTGKSGKTSSTKSSKSSSKDWWSGAPTVSNAPSSEKEWSGWWSGKSGKSTSTKSSKSSSKDWSGGSWKPEPEEEDPLDVEINIKYSGIDKCDYTLTVSFDHDEDLPIGNATTCSPMDIQIAPDGLPYLAFREFEYGFSDSVYRETGFASISLDYQACGHPPFGVFTTPHWDMHFYTDPTEVREKRTCDQPAGAPICIPLSVAQTTNSGRAFFNINTIWKQISGPASEPTGQPANMPKNFTCDMEAAIPASGIHCWDYATNPTAMTWVEPVLIMGSYDGNIAFWEPMAALSFVTGSEDTYYSDTVEYEGQTIGTLPKEYSISYEAATGRAAIVLKGERASCGEKVA